MVLLASKTKNITKEAMFPWNILLQYWIPVSAD